MDGEEHPYSSSILLLSAGQLLLLSDFSSTLAPFAKRSRARKHRVSMLRAHASPPRSSGFGTADRSTSVNTELELAQGG
jgi:hypothetical protein